MVSNSDVRAFWEQHPVAAEAIEAPLGSREFFESFDRLREAPECEPYDFSNKIHGYTGAAGRRVLDVGCGNGYVLAQYARCGAEVHGVDLTETAVALSRQRFERYGLDGDFSLTDGDSIAYPDEHFDIVCSMGVLHHIEDPCPMLREMARVLRPGGALILMLYYRYSYKYLVILPLKRLLHPRYRDKTQAEALNMNDGDDCPLARVYTKGEVAALLPGFEDVRFDLNQLGWRQLFLFPPLGQLAGYLLPRPSESFFAKRLGWNLYVRARKPRLVAPSP